MILWSQSVNLPDLIRRKDRAVVTEAGTAESCSFGLAANRMRAVEFAPNTILRLKDAHEFNVLRDFPSDLDWQLVSGGTIRIVAQPHATGLEPTTVAVATFDGTGNNRLSFDWPVWTLTSGFDLVIEAEGDTATVLAVGRLLDPRAKMAACIRGKGLELGPGLTPRILPREGLEIDYVEEKTPQEWQAVYGRGDASTAALTQDVMDCYRVGSALTLEQWAPASLDFVFSNHVFEHLSNPLQVLRNWLGRLKPGGCVLAVVPDTRFTFDLRQKTSTIVEMLEEEAVGGYEISDEKYHRWCRHTAPYNTMDDLKRRKYSIHVNYYTPALMRDIADLLIKREECSGIFMISASNNKEFGVIIQR